MINWFKNNKRKLWALLLLVALGLAFWAGTVAEIRSFVKTNYPYFWYATPTEKWVNLVDSPELDAWAARLSMQCPSNIGGIILPEGNYSDKAVKNLYLYQYAVDALYSVTVSEDGAIKTVSLTTTTSSKLPKVKLHSYIMGLTMPKTFPEIASECEAIATFK